MVHGKPEKIQEDLLAHLKESGVPMIDGEYRLSLTRCEDCLAEIFTNLPARTIKFLMDQLIIAGRSFTAERQGNGRWVVVIAEKPKPVSYKEEPKFPKKKKLREFLLGMKAAGQKIDLMNFTYFCRLLCDALSEDKRWKFYTKMCKDRKMSATGETLPETILEHTGIDTPMLGGMMLAKELKAGTVLSYDVLPVTFFLHDLPEGIALKGDVDYTLKGKDVDVEEDDAFALMTSIFDDEIREYFERAYAIVDESGKVKRAGLPIEQASLDAQLFTAVEIAGYLSRALYEVKAGNIVFGNTFWNHREFWNYFWGKFVSFEALIGPHAQFMEAFMATYCGAEWRKELTKK